MSQPPWPPQPPPSPAPWSPPGRSWPEASWQGQSWPGQPGFAQAGLEHGYPAGPEHGYPAGPGYLAGPGYAAGPGYPGQWPGPYGTMPPGGPAPGLSRRVVIALVAAGALFVAALGVGVFLLFSGGDGGPLPAPAATLPAAGLGADPWLDRLAQDCHDGDMAACDDLYAQSELESRYETYGDTCAGRRDGGQWTFCTDVFADSLDPSGAPESPSA